MQWTKMAFISPDSLSLFFDEFFFRCVENHSEPETETPNFGGYAMLAKIPHIQLNDLFFQNY